MISSRDTLKFGVTLLVSYCLLTLIMVAFGEYLLRILLPLYSFFINIISTELQVQSIALDNSGTTKQILTVVINPELLHLGKSSLPAGVPIQLSTLQGHSLQHLIIIYSILLAWPPILSNNKQLATNKLKLLLISLPFVLIVEFFDVPFVLLGSAYDLIYSNLAPELVTSSLMIKFMDFLNGGGRLAFSLTAAIFTLATYNLIQTKSYNRLLLLMFSNAKPIKL